MTVIEYAPIIILAFLSGMTTLIGVWAALLLQASEKSIAAGIGFSTGMMILISVFGLIPAASYDIGIFRTLLFAGIGILFFGSLNYLLPHVHLLDRRDRESCILMKTAYLCMIGFILHDLPEGFAMANAYILSGKLGLVMALSIALHNIPEEFAMAMPVILAKRSKRFIYKMAFFSGLAEPAGALIGIVAAHFLPVLTPIFLSFAAGAMIFIALHELYPLARAYHSYGFFLAGASLSMAVYLVLGYLV